MLPPQISKPTNGETSTKEQSIALIALTFMIWRKIFYITHGKMQRKKHFLGITNNMTVISKRSTITFKEIVQLSKGSLTNVLDQQGL